MGRAEVQVVNLAGVGGGGSRLDSCYNAAGHSKSWAGGGAGRIFSVAGGGTAEESVVKPNAAADDAVDS